MDEVFQAERELYDKPGSPDQPFDKQLVCYGQVGDRRLDATLYRPRQTPTDGMAIVFVHGGGWWEGDRGQFARQSAYMATLGFTCLCVSYRLSREARYPACVQDAKCGVRWLRANAARLGVDANRIAVAGSSAGAHIAALVATTGVDDPFEPAGWHEGESSRVSAAALYNGIFRLPVDSTDTLAVEALRVLFGAAPEEAPELYRSASPLYRVDANSPPCLLLHGEADRTVSPQQSIEFCTELRRHGVHGEVEIYPGVAHGGLNDARHLPLCRDRMIAFLQQRL